MHYCICEMDQVLRLETTFYEQRYLVATMDISSFIWVVTAPELWGLSYCVLSVVPRFPGGWS